MRKSDTYNEQILRTAEVEADGISYTYTLSVSTSKRVASFRLPLYTIGVRMRSADGEVSEADTGAIFADVGKAVVFYERLVDNLATPIDLLYVLEDSITV